MRGTECFAETKLTRRGSREDPGTNEPMSNGVARVALSGATCRGDLWLCAVEPAERMPEECTGYFRIVLHADC